MFYYIHEWYKWFNSFSNGIKKDEVTPESNATSGEIPFEDPLPTQRIEKSETEPITDESNATSGEIPFEEPLPKQRIYSTGWKYK
jgi:hypothetical protein